MRPIFFLFFLILAAGFSHALMADEVFIQNKGTAVTNHPVIVPISFVEGQYQANQLSTIQLKSGTENLLTQVDPTSYYKTGSVRTAVARVLVSLSSNQEKIFTIGTYAGSPPAFVMDPKVDTFLKNGQFSVVIRDIKGGSYETKIDVDNPLYSGHVTLVSDGALFKIYKIIKRHDPVAGGTSEDLSHLFTSVFFVTIISGKDYVLVDHFLVNSNNMAEDPAPQTTGGFPGGQGYLYSTPQYGTIFYKDAQVVVDTGSTPHSLQVLDMFLHAPSRYEISESTPTHTLFSIMPEDGQQTLKTVYSDGPTLAQQSNFIGSGQGFLTRFTVSLGSPMVKHPLEEYTINAGQSLERWSKVDSYFFRDIIDPNKLNPTFNWETETANTYNGFISEITNPIEAHRFGAIALSQQKDLRAGGYWEHYFQEPKTAVRYLMSCSQHCQKNMLDAMRFRLYGFAHASNYIVGFDSSQHPDTMISTYQSPLIEKETTDPLNPVTCGAVYSSKDLLGYCHPTKGTPSAHRTDAFGQSMLLYAQQGPSRALWHQWDMSPPSHFSNGTEYYRYLFTGDHMSKYMGDVKLQVSIGNVWKYLQTHTFNEAQTRGRGRALKNATFAYTLDKNPYFKTLGTWIVTAIDNSRNKAAPSTTGQNPFALGDDYAVKYYNSETDPGEEWIVRPFAHYLVQEGLAVAYRDLFTPSDTATVNTLKTMIKDGLFFTHEYGYKKPTEVRNGINVTVSGNSYPLNEGMGFFTDYYRIIFKLPPSTPTSTKHNTYPGNREPEEQPGLVNAMIAASEMRKADPSFMPEYDQYYADYQEAYKAVWESSGQKNIFTNPDLWGLSLTDLTDEPLFGMTFFTGIPTAANRGYVNGYFSSNYSPSCTDNDNDGLTSCAGDCNDANPNIHSNQSETSCTDGVDNNCNELKDCADPVCGSPGSVNPACVGKPYCGNLVLDAGEQCDVVPSLSGGVNLIPPYTCVPAFVPFYQGCQYTAASSYYLSTVNPSIIPYAQASTLTLLGGGFVTGDSVKIDSLTLTPSSLSPTSITVTVSAAQTLTLGPGPHTILVSHAGESTNSLPLTIQQSAPALASITPSAINTGSASQLFVLSGTGFQSGAQVKVGSLPYALATFVAADQLTFTLSASAIATLGAAQHAVFVQNPDGGTSGSVTLTILSPGSPVLDAYNPIDVEWNTGPTTITLTGSNIQAGATVTLVDAFNATKFKTYATTFISSGSVTFSIPKTDTLTLGPSIYTLSLRNPDNKFSNTLLNFVIYIPYVTDTSPDLIATTTPAILTITGYYFKPTAMIHLGTQIFTPTTNTGTVLTLNLSVTQLQSFGTGSVDAYVENPAGGASNIFTLTFETPGGNSNGTGNTSDSSSGSSGGSGGSGGGSGGGSSSGPTGGFDIGDAIPDLGENPTLTCIPSLELCDGVDNDCNGYVDESCSTISLNTGTNPLIYGLLAFFSNILSLLIALVQFIFGR